LIAGATFGVIFSLDRALSDTSLLVVTLRAAPGEERKAAREYDLAAVCPRSYALGCRIGALKVARKTIRQPRRSFAYRHIVVGAVLQPGGLSGLIAG
jgi:hypothetical protein